MKMVFCITNAKKKMDCVYSSYGAQIYGWTHLIPWIVPLALSAASITRTRYGKQHWGKQIMIVLYSLWITVVQLMLYIVQSYFNEYRSDPYCPDMKSLAYPSLEAFYTASLVTYIIAFTYFWDIVLPWTYWSLLFVFMVVPPGILVWFAYNLWYEVLVSSLIGIATTLYFVVLVRFILLDDIPIMLHQRPWTWFACVDTYLMDEEQHNVHKRLLITLERLEKHGFL